MKPVHWLLLIAGLFALVLWRVLQNTAPAPQSPGMKTLSKTKKPARTVPRRAAAPGLVRLTPPPGLSAAEFLKNLPPPSKDFDADSVARVVACRSDR